MSSIIKKLVITLYILLSIINSYPDNIEKQIVGQPQAVNHTLNNNLSICEINDEIHDEINNEINDVYFDSFTESLSEDKLNSDTFVDDFNKKYDRSENDKKAIDPENDKQEYIFYYNGELSFFDDLIAKLKTYGNLPNSILIIYQGGHLTQVHLQEYIYGYKNEQKSLPNYTTYAGKIGGEVIKNEHLLKSVWSSIKESKVFESTYLNTLKVDIKNINKFFSFLDNFIENDLKLLDLPENPLIKTSITKKQQKKITRAKDFFSLMKIYLNDLTDQFNKNIETFEEEKNHQYSYAEFLYRQAPHETLQAIETKLLEAFISYDNLGNVCFLGVKPKDIKYDFNVVKQNYELSIRNIRLAFGAFSLKLDTFLSKLNAISTKHDDTLVKHDDISDKIDEIIYNSSGEENYDAHDSLSILIAHDLLYKNKYLNYSTVVGSIYSGMSYLSFARSLGALEKSLIKSKTTLIKEFFKCLNGKEFIGHGVIPKLITTLFFSEVRRIPNSKYYTLLALDLINAGKLDFVECLSNMTKVNTFDTRLHKDIMCFINGISTEVFFKPRSYFDVNMATFLEGYFTVTGYKSATKEKDSYLYTSDSSEALALDIKRMKKKNILLKWIEAFTQENYEYLDDLKEFTIFSDKSDFLKEVLEKMIKKITF